MNISLKKGIRMEDINSVFEKNKIDFKLIDSVYKGNNYKHNWKCSCGNIILKRTFKKIKDRDSIKCKKCKYREIEERYKENVEKDEKYLYIRSFRKGDILPNGKKVGDVPYIKIKHLNCGRIYEVTAAGFIDQKKRCRCAPYERSIACRNPQISKEIYADENGKIVEEKDKRSIHAMSTKKYHFKCNKCGVVSQKCISLSDAYRNGRYSCEFCSDGISLPERFMANLLLSINIDFIPHMHFEWSRNIKRGNNKKLWGSKHYDFYIPKMNIIIETHGIQHFEESPRGRSLKEEQENDDIKRDIAIEELEEKNYITIDCRKSELKWLKVNIIKALNNVVILENIDWNYIWQKSQESFIVITWELWNQGYSIKEISKQMNLCMPTIRQYLKKGAIINKCSYDSEVEKNNLKRKIICVTTEEVFNSITEAAKKFGLTLKNLSRCCKSKNKIYGNLNGRPLVWMYYEEYCQLSNFEILKLKEIKHGIIRQILNVTTGELFSNSVKAGEKYGIERRLVSACCEHKSRYSGILEDGRKLVWVYYDEYLEANGDMTKIEKKLAYIGKRVKCTTTNEEFDKIKSAAQQYNVSEANIVSCCKNKRNYAGKSNEGNKLVWQYVD